MTAIDADKFLAYLIFSKHIDGLTCGEVKEAIEMCKVDVLDKIRAEILAMMPPLGKWMYEEGHIEEQTACEVIADVLQIIDKYKAESEG